MIILQAILSVLLIAPVSTMMRNGDEPLEVQLRETNPADEIHRSSAQIPIVCLLDQNSSTITLLSKEFLACDVVVVNESLEEMSAYPCVISSSPTIVPLNTTGEYHISITLINGTCYYGDFSI